MTPIRIFIGSDIYNIKAEQALKFSILKNTKSPVEFNVMSRFDQENIWKDWQHTSQWATCFSCFRWAIPAACKFEGRAIYLDSDMIVLGDIQELYDSDCSKGIATTPSRESSVTVFDCARFKDMAEFQIDHLKANAVKTNLYYNLLKNKSMVNFITQDWNCLDGEGWSPTKTRLVHYTKLTTQPWHPAPHRFKYEPHPHEDVTKIWLTYYEQSFAASNR